MPTPLRIAILGTGGVARTHARHWLGQGDAGIVACADSDPARSASFVSELGLAPDIVRADLAGLLAARPDAVAICTPPYLHQPQAEQCLAAGVHAIVEKPICGSLAAFDRLLALERSSGRRVIPVLQNRCGPGPAQLRALQSAGLAGRFLHGSIETAWRRGPDYYAAPWRGRHRSELGGCLAGLAIHQIDLVLGFLPPPAFVYGHADTLVHAIEVEDTAAALVGLAGGSWLTVTASVHAHEQRSRGMLVFERVQVEFGPDPYSYASVPWQVHCADATHAERVRACLAEHAPAPFPPGLDALWWPQSRHWADLIRGGDGGGNDLASARPAHELAAAIYAASKRRCRIDLPLSPADGAYQRMAP